MEQVSTVDFVRTSLNSPGMCSQRKVQGCPKPVF
jgi:hypothetical protein